MVTKTELQEVLVNGENSGVEFERDEIEDYQLAKTLVAFSNLCGGMVLLGVEEDGTITGIKQRQLKEWVMETCRDKIRPEIIPYFKIIKNIEPNKDVAIVRVLRGISEHCLWHNSKESWFIRFGSKSREMSPQEISHLFQQRGGVPTNLQPISGSIIDDLDRRRLKDYFGRIRQQEMQRDDDVIGWRKFLFHTGFMGEEGVSLAGMLLFGNLPKQFLPQSGIEAVAYSGIAKDHSIKERLSINTSFTPLMDAQGNVLEAGVVEQALEFVRRNSPVKVSFDERGRRVERSAYPREAVREAIVNALIHRDYQLWRTNIELAVYQDRLEIVSPGKLPNGITSESVRAGARATRNQLLKDVMRDYGYMEQLGMGVRRKIVHGMRDHNQSDPDLIEDDERFIVRLFA